MRFLDADHPFFRRPVARWGTALAPLVWAVVEFATGNPGWGILFGAAGAYAAWALLIVGPSDK
ncbi:hypothetical protein [Gemmobacter caeruleus]|uniref:hypothetical protein n=1 Tax=Gemmobacter caeruleus TaxID=2595004 RepID=UPI0011EBC990|nr:hypothetical protein [Gemmobacter caeruleus]